MTQATSLLPEMLGSYLPPANPVAGLSDNERALIAGLSTKLAYQTTLMWTTQAYYDGTQKLANLGVSIPPSLAGVRTVVDWPRICVDPLVQRAVIDGYRLPKQTDTDSELWEFHQANSLGAEIPLCVLDSLTLGRGYTIVGPGDNPGDAPIITVESPFNVALNWDPRTRRVTSAYQSFEAEGVYRAALYLPNVTVQMSRDAAASEWAVDDRDEHMLGQTLVVRWPNRARTSDREGRSEISAPIRNTTDSAVRTLLGMEIAREFYSVPHRYVLGATESDFQDAEGNAKSAIEMVMSKMLAFERNDRGDLPTVGQFQAFDPSVFTKIIDKGAMLMASYTGYPPEYFGQVNTANPASADAIRSSQDGLNRRGKQVQSQHTLPAKETLQLAWRVANNGAALPAEMRHLEVDWAPVETPTPAATADAMFKQEQMGAVPATSDVTLTRLGYSAVERARLAQDRAKDQAAQQIAEVATSEELKQLRATKTLTADAQPTTTGPVQVPAHTRQPPAAAPDNSPGGST